MRVAVGGEDLVDIAFAGRDELEYGNIKRAAAKIVDGHAAALLFVQAVGERSGSRFVDEPQNFQAGDFAGVLRSLALRVVEISRHGDNGTIDCLAEKSFRPVFQLAENERRNFRWCEEFFAQHDANDVFARGIDAKRKKLQLALNIGGTAAHQTFHGIDRALGLGQKTAARWLAHDDAAVRVKAHNRGTERVAVRTGDTLRLACLAVHVSHQAIRCSQIDSDDSAHNDNPQGLKPLRYTSSFCTL